SIVRPSLLSQDPTHQPLPLRSHSLLAESTFAAPLPGGGSCSWGRPLPTEGGGVMDELPSRANAVPPDGRLEAAEFLSLLYGELRRLAAHCLALPSTALVHEVYLRLAATSPAPPRVDPPPTGCCLWVSMSCFAQWARLEFVQQSDCADCQIARSARNSSI